MDIHSSDCPRQPSSSWEPWQKTPDLGPIYMVTSDSRLKPAGEQSPSPPFFYLGWKGRGWADPVHPHPFSLPKPSTAQMATPKANSPSHYSRAI